MWLAYFHFFGFEIIQNNLKRLSENINSESRQNIIIRGDLSLLGRN